MQASSRLPERLPWLLWDEVAQASESIGRQVEPTARREAVAAAEPAAPRPCVKRQVVEGSGKR